MSLRALIAGIPELTGCRCVLGDLSISKTQSSMLGSHTIWHHPVRSCEMHAQSAALWTQPCTCLQIRPCQSTCA